MKPTIVFVFTLFLVQSECRWFPEVSGFTDYVRQRGRDIKKYYIDTVRSKVNKYILNDASTDNPESTDNPLSTVRAIRSCGSAPAALPPQQVNPKPGSATSASDTDNNIPKETRVRNVADDDPVIHMTTPQIIAMHGYPAESHTVLTDDGYLLTLHRIPLRQNKDTTENRQKTVLLHHGLFGSSADWVISGPGKALAFILADSGFDVWMANVRGNTYSRSHISRPVDSFAFWNFSFHEVSQHDLPAVIDYMMNINGWDVKINYIGHSMGTTILFALLSTKTHYNKVLRAGYALAPVAYMSDIKSPIRMLARFANSIEYFMKLVGENEFLPQSNILKWLSKHACEINHYEEKICENTLFVLCGFDAKQFNSSLLPVILSHNPAGASTKTLIHYAQIIHNDGRFQMFDYGREKNLVEYGSVLPPEYPLHKITLPIALLSADNDWLSSEVDVTNLFVQLAKPIEHYIVPLKEFNHIDFLWAIDAPKFVYNKLIQLLEDGVTIHSYFNPDMMGSIDLNV